MNDIANILKEPFSSTPVVPAPDPLARAAVWVVVGLLLARL